MTVTVTMQLLLTLVVLVNKACHTMDTDRNEIGFDK